MMRHLIVAGLLLASAPAGAFDFNALRTKVGELSKPAANESSTSTTGLAQFSTQDQIESLRQALTQGAQTAVTTLSKQDGYLGNPKVHIPLPDNLRKADSALRRIGLGRYPDELITAMNRSAEAAVPEATALLIGAVKQMTIADAATILTGPDDAATQYFRKTTEASLTGRFQPIIGNAMQKVKLAETYNRFAGQGAKLGLVDKRDARLEDYITRRALDGLFLMMAEQEQAIRANPLSATGDLARKIFATIKP